MREYGVFIEGCIWNKGEGTFTCKDAFGSPCTLYFFDAPMSVSDLVGQRVGLVHNKMYFQQKCVAIWTEYATFNFNPSGLEDSKTREDQKVGQRIESQQRRLDSDLWLDGR